ncbi:MAG TPA: hypothetical protein PKD86_09095 [Gemmatales bacterium]|nr:hypothetical protein [Gemmatales bacterium]HMP59494.1 hypothetical protein [Gemmatales bacterium]
MHATQQGWARRLAWGLGLGLVLAMVATAAVARSDAAWPIGPPEPEPAADWKVLFEADWSQPNALERLRFTDRAAWRLADHEGRRVLELFQASRFQPPHRSPLSLALIDDLRVGSFVLDVECMQTSRDYPHRDLVFVLGYQAPAEYYYVHIAAKADDHANNIFLVHQAPRRKIGVTTNDGNDWGQNQWRKVRVRRDVAEGTIEVFFDDMSKPIMTALDRTLGPGLVGIGSFDDTGRFAQVRLRGPALAPSPNQ